MKSTCWFIYQSSRDILQNTRGKSRPLALDDSPADGILVCINYDFNNPGLEDFNMLSIHNRAHQKSFEA